MPMQASMSRRNGSAELFESTFVSNPIEHMAYTCSTSTTPASSIRCRRRSVWSEVGEKSWGLWLSCGKPHKQASFQRLSNDGDIHRLWGLCRFLAKDGMN